MVDYLLGCVNIVIVRKHKQGPNEMTYITEKFTAGEVVVKDFVAGWEFAEGFDGNYEHRPLMADAMKELLEAGLVTELHVEATAIARSINLQKNLGIYKQAQAERTPAQVAEERMEARAAMGPGVDMVNIVTGEKFVS
mgnify:FL=1|jgi:hypothetical protein|tara:strand:+ start:484 stop:897 length:414 start_codon:yes stop_codon:yes gene_type:complete